MPCERKCDPDQSKTGWGWIPERCPWTPSGGMGARRRLPTVATVMDHNALRGDPLLHHQSRLSQKERVAGVQLTPIIRSLSDPRASCPWCACNTSWCSYRIAQLLGRSDNGRQGSLPPFSQLSAPLTAQHLHLSLAVLNTFTLRRSEGESIQHRQPEMKMLDCERYTRFGSAGSRRKMVC